VGTPSLLSALPAFVVPDVRAAVAHYRDVLGFQVSPENANAELFAIVNLAPGQGVQLKRGNGPSALGAYVYLSLEEVEALAGELARRGANIRSPLQLRAWNMREIIVADHLGHQLRIGAPPDGRWPAGKPRLVPEIHAADVDGALAFSRQVLGFQELMSRKWGDRLDWAAASRDRARLHWGLAESPQRNRTRGQIWDVYIETRGVDALAAELHGRGATITRGPLTTVYGMRELEVQAPEGIALCFGEAS
jgi:uncharacterized glyoxalase superfamily protein PhnB